MAGRQSGFWDVQERLRELSAQGDPLEKVAATVGHLEQYQFLPALTYEGFPYADRI